MANFTVNHGGGFGFHQLRCVRCGRAKRVSFQDIGEQHARYLKGSRRPYTVIDSAEHQNAREDPDIEQLSGDEYYAAVEVAAGKCDCGGKLSFDARARCPRCGSAEIVEGETFASYD